jgi:hypothetical protein
MSLSRGKPQQCLQDQRDRWLNIPKERYGLDLSMWDDNYGRAKSTTLSWVNGLTSCGQACQPGHNSFMVHGGLEQAFVSSHVSWLLCNPYTDSLMHMNSLMHDTQSSKNKLESDIF